MNKHALWVLVCIAAVAFGCAASSGKTVGQAAMKDFETRTIDAPVDQVFLASTEALFDLGYTIKHSDRQSGILVGEKQDARKHDKTTMALLGYAAFGPAGLLAASTVDPVVFNVTLLIRPLDERTTNVRIKMSVDGEPKLDRKSVDQVWLYIDRQVLMESPPDVSVTTPVAKAPEAGATKGEVLEGSSKAPTVKKEIAVSHFADVYSGPGTHFQKLGSVPEATVLEMLEEKDGWFRFSSAQYPAGWISQRDCGISPTHPVRRTAFVRQKAGVMSGPGGSAGFLGALEQGCTITIIEERNEWVRFSSAAYADGWVHKSFIVQDNDTGFPVELKDNSTAAEPPGRAIRMRR